MFVAAYHTVMEDLVTTTEVAEVLGVSRRRVQALIKAGRLPARAYGTGRTSMLLIARADLEAFKVKPVGRPKKVPEPKGKKMEAKDAK
jgi:excisionase family DNA binding protein